jgi:hypothetical protein
VSTGVLSAPTAPSLKEGPPTPEERAILRTVAYASLFEAPLSVSSLGVGLMERRLHPETIRRRLEGPYLARRLVVREGQVVPRGREAWLDLARMRRVHTTRLVESHRTFLARAARVPFVRLLALSGACAHENASDHDVDVFVVAARGRAWLVSATLLSLTKAAGLRRSLCVNYVVDEAALALPERDVFTAREILALRTLAGPRTHRRLLEENGWVRDHFPGLYEACLALPPVAREGGSPLLEWIFERGPGPLLEGLARRVLGAHLRRTVRGPGVVLSAHRLKLHSLDHRPRLLAAFAAAVAALEEGG